MLTEKKSADNERERETIPDNQKIRVINRVSETHQNRKQIDWGWVRIGNEIIGGRRSIRSQDRDKTKEGIGVGEMRETKN